MPNHHTVDDYITSFPPNISAQLQKIRQAVKTAIPDSDDALSYGVPALRLKGKNLILYAAFKQHIGIYPGPATIEKFASELTAYQLAKGTIQIKFDQPLPLKLIVRLAQYNASLAKIA